MNVVLRGKTKEILNEMVAEGYANTLSEAIRLAILSFEQRFNEGKLVSQKLDWIDTQIKEGKRKELNAEEALGEYAKHLE